ncbi:hypothetical protein LENED_012860 [Lentinula edodes]|uniref:Uncharacterized protein n=1 Tax=Lentinula edodes TaxID=5353 RepID=A0A1Q3ETS1_LENED|nr:hypothetical protein LENED_012860 [Lentinula edodes]
MTSHDISASTPSPCLQAQARKNVIFERRINRHKANTKFVWARPPEVYKRDGRLSVECYTSKIIHYSFLDTVFTVGFLHGTFFSLSFLPSPIVRSSVVLFEVPEKVDMCPLVALEINEILKMKGTSCTTAMGSFALGRLRQIGYRLFL